MPVARLKTGQDWGVGPGGQAEDGLQGTHDEFAETRRNHPALAAFASGISNRRASPMIQWILILLIVAAVAGLLGFGRLSGVALSGAKLLIGLVLVLFLLAVLGIVAIA